MPKPNPHYNQDLMLIKAILIPSIKIKDLKNFLLGLVIASKPRLGLEFRPIPLIKFKKIIQYIRTLVILI